MTPAAARSARRIFAIALLVGGVYFYQRSQSVRVPLHVQLGPAAATRAPMEIELYWIRLPQGDIAQEGRYRLTSGDADLYRTLSLRPGRYRVVMRCRGRDGHVVERTQEQDVVPERVIELDAAPAGTARTRAD